MKNLKVAIIHDVFIEQGGAERVLICLLKMFPKADLYVPLISQKHFPFLQKLTKGRVKSSLFNYIPFIHSASILLKPFLYWYWEQLDLNTYDLIISSSHSFSSKSVLTKPESLHVSYIHTSPRYLYTEFNETKIIRSRFFKVILTPLLSWLRIQDFIGAQRPDILVANSATVQKRIKKYYRRESKVIYPPISLPVKFLKKKKEYYLCVSRLAKQKGIDLAIEAFNKLQLPLIIVGTGSELNNLKLQAGSLISFKGYVEDPQMAEIYARAKALVYCSIDEDFGMVPVEAMACGVPVIGYKSGGTAETVIDNVTGKLFDEFSSESLIQAVTKFEKLNTKNWEVACKERANFFSEKKFIKEISRLTIRKYD